MASLYLENSKKNEVEAHSVIAITSHRPLDQCTKEIRENQLRAHRNWLTAFERMIYVGEYSSELHSILSEFVPAEDRPSIQSLCAIAAQMGTWTALINADIQVPPKIKEVERRMDAQGIKCAVSQRYDLESGFVIDQGLDFFCAVPSVWEAAAKKIPSEFRIGYGSWDNFMLGFFVCEYGRKCADISRERCVFHPRHNDRKNPNWEGKALEHKYIRQHFWPSMILR